MNQTRVAILGSGNIGTDLLVKVCRSEYLECGVLIGRDPRSPGLAKASQYGVPVSAAGIEHLEREPDCCEIVFDATSALGHAAHAPILHRLGKMAIDLTPANLGAPCVPVVNVDECVTLDNVNVITCGGQASIPIAHALARTQHSVSYLEVVSSIAARSAGPATRRNLDEYIHTTEYGLTRFSGVTRTKAILNINPAQPCIDMQTTISARVAEPDLDALVPELDALVTRIRRYVPGYEVLVGPIVEDGRIAVMVRVRGRGDHLPAYAGNLDIVNCAAVAVAEECARGRRTAVMSR